MPTQSRPVVRPSIAKIKSSKADTFETITELDGGLSEDNKTIFTTTWRLDYGSKRVPFQKSRADDGQQVDVVMQRMVRMSHRREQAMNENISWIIRSKACGVQGLEDYNSK